jgi:hypothetical protein
MVLIIDFFGKYLAVLERAMDVSRHSFVDAVHPTGNANVGFFHGQIPFNNIVSRKVAGMERGNRGMRHMLHIVANDLR